MGRGTCRARTACRPGWRAPQGRPMGQQDWEIRTSCALPRDPANAAQCLAPTLRCSAKKVNQMYVAQPWPTSLEAAGIHPALFLAWPADRPSESMIDVVSRWYVWSVEPVEFGRNGGFRWRLFRTPQMGCIDWTLRSNSAGEHCEDTGNDDSGRSIYVGDDCLGVTAHC